MPSGRDSMASRRAAAMVVMPLAYRRATET